MTQQFERSYKYISNILHFGLQIRNAQITWSTWNVEIPVLTHVQIQKGARFVKPHVRMAVSVPQVSSSLLSVITHIKGQKGGLFPFFTTSHNK